MKKVLKDEYALTPIEAGVNYEMERREASAKYQMQSSASTSRMFTSTQIDKARELQEQYSENLLTMRNTFVVESCCQLPQVQNASENTDFKRRKQLIREWRK